MLPNVVGGAFAIWGQKFECEFCRVFSITHFISSTYAHGYRVGSLFGQSKTDPRPPNSVDLNGFDYPSAPVFRHFSVFSAIVWKNRCPFGENAPEPMPILRISCHQPIDESRIESVQMVKEGGRKIRDDFVLAPFDCLYDTVCNII